MIKRIGCIGLGVMGAPIAMHLIRAGYDVRGYARRADFFETDGAELTKAGLTPSDHPAAMAADVDLIITNVISGEDVHEVLIDHEQAVCHGAHDGLIVMDHSTIAPDMTRQIGQVMKDHGIGWVDAPVSGGGIGAVAGTLVSMLGGDENHIAAVAPVLSAYTSGYRHIGATGAGQVAKLCNQIAQVVTIQGVAEAMQFAAIHDADQNAVLDVMMQGFASSRMLELMAPKMIADDFSPGMESRLHAKDLDVACKAAKQNHQTLPASELVLTLLHAIQENGWNKKDTSILYQHLKKNH
jgi:3-hydroxyisobutyrate dehydrogenase-like beta-hydroxyacid dehydrogenase